MAIKWVKALLDCMIRAQHGCSLFPILVFLQSVSQSYGNFIKMSPGIFLALGLVSEVGREDQLLVGLRRSCRPPGWTQWSSRPCEGFPRKLEHRPIGWWFSSSFGQGYLGAPLKGQHQVWPQNNLGRPKRWWRNGSQGDLMKMLRRCPWRMFSSARGWCLIQCRNRISN